MVASLVLLKRIVEGPTQRHKRLNWCLRSINSLQFSFVGVSTETMVMRHHRYCFREIWAGNKICINTFNYTFSTSVSHSSSFLCFRNTLAVLFWFWWVIQTLVEKYLLAHSCLQLCQTHPLCTICHVIQFKRPKTIASFCDIYFGMWRHAYTRRAT